MKIFISRYNGKLILSDLEVFNDTGKLISVGFPCFQFELAERLDGSIEQLACNFDLKEGQRCKLELRKWPKG